ncbi:hypothetical protein F4778DRAFT_744618 [Xylariomycetidae sp. FL2044]|nr:hypothetical protein F4778DRAFT_744618 [Xylariomycetidae sp. FL2044]
MICFFQLCLSPPLSGLWWLVQRLSQGLGEGIQGHAASDPRSCQWTSDRVMGARAGVKPQRGVVNGDFLSNSYFEEEIKQIGTV